MTDAEKQIREALAARPTPGQWFAVNDGNRTEPFMNVKAERISGRGPTHEVAICATGDSPQSMETANARYIAACSPVNMTAILAHVEAQAAEIERLTACLKKANDQAEHFEREWYLRGDEIERLETDVRKLDFLELNGIGCDKIGGLGYSVWINGVRYDGDTARNAIDAAMRGSDE